MTLSQSDKVVLTKYPIAPSMCVICLRSANGELNFLDFQMSLDIYGSVNICVDCIAPVAQLINYVDKNLLHEAEAQIRNLVEMNRELHENNERLNASIDSLLNLRPDLKQRHLPANEKSDSDSEQLKLDLDVKSESKGSDDRKSAKPNAGGRLKDIIESSTDFDI